MTQGGNEGSSLDLLLAGQMSQRYLRNEATIGVKGQLKLLQAKVAVVGAGGLGGHAIELLARLGVGYLKVIDGDCFDETNLNRQLLASTQTMGTNKAVAAAARVAAINPELELIACRCRLTAENAVELLNELDVIVDGLDNFSSRQILLAVAQQLKIPVVYAAIAGCTGQVSTVLPTDDAIRRLLQQPQPEDRGVEAVLGNPATTPAVAAALQVQEVVKLITGRGQLLSEKLVYFDLESNLFELINL